MAEQSRGAFPQEKDEGFCSRWLGARVQRAPADRTLIRARVFGRDDVGDVNRAIVGARRQHQSARNAYFAFCESMAPSPICRERLE
jgi:hypothetical protein